MSSWQYCLLFLCAIQLSCLHSFLLCVKRHSGINTKHLRTIRTEHASSIPARDVRTRLAQTQWTCALLPVVYQPVVFPRVAYQPETGGPDSPKPNATATCELAFYLPCQVSQPVSGSLGRLLLCR